MKLNQFHPKTEHSKLYVSGLSSPVAECDPGFYCPGGDDVPNPVDTPCPIGLHCPQGSSLPVPCQPGYFANFSQAASCVICPPGYYCVPEEVIEGKIYLPVHVKITYQRSSLFVEVIKLKYKLSNI